MGEGKHIFSDHEYSIMTEVAMNEKITQRQLSKKLHLSVGSINVLINKMIKEGLIKVEQVSAKQVLYMLTPMGVKEKTKKTINYLKVHYQVIDETKEKIKMKLDEVVERYEHVYVMLSEDEMGEIVRVAVQEYKHTHKGAKISVIEKVSDVVRGRNSVAVLHMGTEIDDITGCENEFAVEWINILQSL